MKKYWRVGTKVKLNIYDGDNNPMCQCHTEEMAAFIVECVNAMMETYNKLLSEME